MVLIRVRRVQESLEKLANDDGRSRDKVISVKEAKEKFQEMECWMLKFRICWGLQALQHY